MSGPNEAVIYQLESLDLYLSTTASITTEWFFFAGAVNAAVAGWLVAGRHAERAHVIPRLFVICNAMLAVMYLLLIPLYYARSWARARALTEYLQLPRELRISAFPVYDWTAASIVLGLIALAMALTWWYFFVNTTGKAKVSNFLDVS